MLTLFLSFRGRSGDEMHDYEYTFTNSRRRSNSNTQNLTDFKTKFENIEQEPVFEEELHGPNEQDETKDGLLEKTNSVDTSNSTTSDETYVKKEN